MITRRGFLSAIIATRTAPAVVRAVSLMPLVMPMPFHIDRWVHVCDEPGMIDVRVEFGYRNGAHWAQRGVHMPDVRYGFVILRMTPETPHRLLRADAEWARDRFLISEGLTP